MEDQRILELLKEGRNDKAFLKLYRHYPPVRKMVMTRYGKSQDAEDVFQEALIILCRKALNPQFQLTSSLGTFLYGVSSLLWRKELSKREKRNEVTFDIDLEKFEDQLGEENYMEEKYKAAAKVIDEIGDRCRELLLLFYTTSMKLKDIAIKMGYSSEQSAKNQKYKCLESAKAKLVQLKTSVL